MLIQVAIQLQVSVDCRSARFSSASILSHVSPWWFTVILPIFCFPTNAKHWVWCWTVRSATRWINHISFFILPNKNDSEFLGLHEESHGKNKNTIVNLSLHTCTPFSFLQQKNHPPGVSPETFVSVSLFPPLHHLQPAAIGHAKAANHKRQRKTRTLQGSTGPSCDAKIEDFPGSATRKWWWLGSDPFFCSPLNPPFLEVEPCIYSRLFMEGGYLYLPIYLPILQNSRMKEI